MSLHTAVICMPNFNKIPASIAQEALRIRAGMENARKSNDCDYDAMKKTAPLHTASERNGL